MKQTLFNQGWLTWQETDAFSMVWNIPAGAKPVTLPHDAMLQHPAHAESPNGGNTGYRDGGVYVYCKRFHVPVEWREKTILLRFEGSYCNTFIYLNGQLAADHPNGYTGFTVSLNGFLQYGHENELRVFVRDAASSSRWYSGGGLYRDVYLLTGPLTHIAQDGVWTVTESLDQEYAVLRVETEVVNRSHLTYDCTLETALIDPEGRQIACAQVPLSLAANGRVSVPQRFTVSHPSPWSAEIPALYTCQSRLANAEGECDTAETPFGIRSLSVDARHGLRINGKSVKLLGGCIHHDHGLLGAAGYEQAEERRIRRLKEAGFNAVRISHHPASPALLRACDRTGMYVMNEAFDLWTRAKTSLDYSAHFTDRALLDLEAMVRVARSHPCVILYSIGNEIPECATSAGVRLSAELTATIRAMDATRPITAGINGIFISGDAMNQILGDILPGKDAGQKEGNVNVFMTIMDQHLNEMVVHPAVTERLDRACAFLDVAGYNYMAARYRMDAQRCPNRVMLGSETYPPEFAANWEEIQKLPQVVGDFNWAAWDYIGEAGVGIPAYHAGEGGFGAKFPCQLAYVGDFDITGFRRPASYFRQIAAGLRPAPYIAVQNPHHYGQPLIKTPWVISDATHSWTWPGCEGKPAVVEVYSDAETVELFLNGKSLGVCQPRECIARFETIYRPGMLRAVARCREHICGEDAVRTAGPVAAVRLLAESDTPSGPLVWIDVMLIDSEGRWNDAEDRVLTITKKGGAELLAFGSANPRAGTYPSGITETYKGRAQIILRRTDDPCTIIVTASNGENATLTI